MFDFSSPEAFVIVDKGGIAVDIGVGGVFFFSEGELSGDEGKEDDTSRKDISSAHLAARSVFNFRSSVIDGTTRGDNIILKGLSLIKIDDFELEIASKHDIVELEVEVSNALGMDIFHTFDKLMEIGSGDDVSGQISLGNKVKEVAVLSEFSEQRIKSVIVAVDGNSLDDVLMLKGEHKLFFRILGDAEFGLGEDF